MQLKRKRQRSAWSSYLFLLAPLIIYGVFFIYPSMLALINSFFKWDGISPVKEFVWFRNYQKMLTDKVFHKAFLNTVKYMLTLLVFQTLCGLLLAVLLRKSTRINSLFRTAYFLPMMMSAVTVGLIWSFIYDPNIGALNELLRKIGLAKLTHSWLSDEKLAIYAVAFVHIWVGIGQSTVLFFAGLQNIPGELYESAQIDGATGLAQFVKITLPLLKPTTLTVVVLTTIGAFKSFEYVFVMTGGGATHSSEVLATLLYREAYGYSDFGYSAAISVALLVIVSILTTVQMRGLSEKEGG